jgi:hypothetical protein
MMLIVLKPSSSFGDVSRSFCGLFHDLEAAFAKTQFLRQQHTMENMIRPRKRMIRRAIRAARLGSKSAMEDSELDSEAATMLLMPTSS